MAEKFGLDTQDGKRCPGESDCERYGSAAGSTPEEKGRACISCTICRGLAPLPEERVEEDEISELVDHIERLVWEQQAGRHFDLTELTPEEWQLMVLRKGLERELMLANQLKIAALMEAMMGKKT